MRVVGVIPARYGSSRFPGKPLALIHNKPMIQHVYERVSQSRLIDAVVVATDHEKIRDAVLAFGGQVVMTRTDHETGSDRMAEVTTKIEGDIYVNIQGDEPLMSPELIDSIIEVAKNAPGAVVTAKTEIKDIEDIHNPNVVKVISGKNDYAIYFSRSCVPYNRANKDHIYYKHLGIYSYPKNIINEFVKLPQSPLEEVEMLEQLRLIENGYPIKVLETDYDAVGVDTPEDIQKVEQKLGGKQLV